MNRNFYLDIMPALRQLKIADGKVALIVLQDGEPMLSPPYLQGLKELPFLELVRWRHLASGFVGNEILKEILRKVLSSWGSARLAEERFLWPRGFSRLAKDLEFDTRFIPPKEPEWWGIKSPLDLILAVDQLGTNGILRQLCRKHDRSLEDFLKSKILFDTAPLFGNILLDKECLKGLPSTSRCRVVGNIINPLRFSLGSDRVRLMSSWRQCVSALDEIASTNSEKPDGRVLLLSGRRHRDIPYYNGLYILSDIPKGRIKTLPYSFLGLGPGETSNS